MPKPRVLVTVDEIAAENGKFKALDKPSAEARAKHEEQIEALAGDVKKYAEHMHDAEDPLHTRLLQRLQQNICDIVRSHGGHLESVGG